MPDLPLGHQLLASVPGPLDSDVGALVRTLADGTEYRQVLLKPTVGTVHVTPDGRSWTAVAETVVNGKVAPSPFTLHWKSGPEDILALILKIIALLRRLFPNLFPATPLPAGTVGPEIPLDPASSQQLFVSAATQGSAPTQVWTKDDSELLVSVGQVTVKFDDGLVVVSIPVSCDQVSAAVIQVPFAVGGKTTPAGMLAATEEHPRGPDVIVKVWGEALTAFAWQTFLSVLTRVASKAGVDVDGAGLIPAAITSGTDGLHILTMARHTFDRVSQ
jgi:hypothetical protein